ncbi:hypothetical protein [Apilactobacillus timberlakei]|uniref:hypothetical protein n=1 Tax=Apilactobacillus timberlakei TaxID=2008380 RepID=UPI001129C496|nr:hypothetical protein [Apilactobacillus timberlakei]TPR16273.1 hypothetical protein DYZ95_07855 [Apilactobacillus timberlakei]
MNITKSNLNSVHKSYYDMCLVYEVLDHLLHDPFKPLNNELINDTSYPKVILELMKNIGIYKPKIRFFTTFQLLRGLQPMTKSYSIAAYYSVKVQAETLFEMLEYVIPRISFLNNCHSINDTDELKPMNRLRLEKMVNYRQKIIEESPMQVEFIKYSFLKNQYGYIKDNDIHKIKSNVDKLFQQLKVEYQKDKQWIDTHLAFDDEAKKLNEKAYKLAMLNNNKSNNKSDNKSHKSSYILIIGILFLLFLMWLII